MVRDSWELPSHVATEGIYDFDAHRALKNYEDSLAGAEREAPEGEAQLLPFRRPSVPAETPGQSTSPPAANRRGSDDVPVYHPAPELYEQGALDTLEKSGFHPQGDNAWHRTSGDATHELIYKPGFRAPNGARAPWHLSTDDGESYQPFQSLRRAIEVADGIDKTSAFLDWTKVGAQSRGRQNADDWLARHTDESFEHEPEVSNEAWMQAHEGLGGDEGYTHWNPENDDYTYHDVPDYGGWEFHGDEAAPVAGQGTHFHQENREIGAQQVQPRQHEVRHWTVEDQERYENEREERYRHDQQRLQDLRDRGYLDDDDEDEDSSEDNRINETLSDHGFNWEPKDPTAGTPGNPISPETPGKWVKHQIDLEGKHVATHTLTNDEGHQPGQWKLTTELGEAGLPVTLPTSIHSPGESGLDWALAKYKSNSAEAMLPKYGYEPDYGPAGARRWTKTSPSPEVPGRRHENYEHDIIFPESGFGGTTTNHTHLAHHSFAPNGSHYDHAYDLTDLVREQQRLGQGIHPGGVKDFRMTPEELKNHPSVARLGSPTVTGTHFGDGKANYMTWRLARPEGSPHPVNAEANYNWDTGNYDFKYTHNGDWLAATHGYVPEGAPIRVPGRQRG